MSHSAAVSSSGGPIAVSGGDGGLTVNATAVLMLGATLDRGAESCARRSRDLYTLVRAPFGLLTALADDPADHNTALLTAACDDLERAAFDLGLLGRALADLGDHLVRVALRYSQLEQHLFGNLLAGIPALLATLDRDDTRFWTTLYGTHDVRRSLQSIVCADPGQLDSLARHLNAHIRLYELLESDGHGVARSTDVDTAGAAGIPPRTLTDVLDDLAQRDADGRSGEIDVRILTMPDGSRRAIVDVTGTKSWDPLPTSDVTSLSTNARALDGLITAYEQGVLAAMHQAGVRHGDGVLMVGHSQGGMVVVNAARRAVLTGEFDVTHVVTVGAPVGRTAGSLPSQTQLLALENRFDVIPHLDGRANADRRNVTTVTGRAGDGTVSGDHDIVDGYEPIARAAQHSDNRSIRDFLESADGYFRAESIVTRTYQIERR